MSINFKQILIAISLCINCFLSFSQDIHFSQFNNSPTNLNPALTGVFNGEFRLVANQRSQWRAITQPYNTFSLAADAKNIYQTPVSTGLSFYNDQAGDGQLSTTQIAVPVAYTYYLKKPDQSITGAIQPAFTQQSIDYNKFRFDNQYDGTSFNSGLGNGESFSNTGKNYFNLHAGLTWNYRIAQRKSVTAGIAIHNIIQPKTSFFDNNNIELKRRLTIHANGLLAVHNKIDVLPGLFFGQQNQFKEIIFGGSGKFHLNKGDYQAVYFGIWHRNQDAIYFTSGLDYGNFHFGVSYDLNISSLNEASNYRGGFEFALIYIFERFKPKIKRYKACPNFI